MSSELSDRVEATLPDMALAVLFAQYPEVPRNIPIHKGGWVEAALSVRNEMCDGEWFDKFMSQVAIHVEKGAYEDWGVGITQLGHDEENNVVLAVKKFFYDTYRGGSPRHCADQALDKISTRRTADAFLAVLDACSKINLISDSVMLASVASYVDVPYANSCPTPANKQLCDGSRYMTRLKTTRDAFAAMFDSKFQNQT